MKAVKDQALLLRKRSLVGSLTAGIVFFACAGVCPIAVSAQTTDAPSANGVLRPSQTSLLQDQQEAVLLDPDKPIQRELAAGQKHTYQITLPAGQYAELAMMKRKGRSHPFYWASFIQLGEWANLDGKR